MIKNMLTKLRKTIAHFGDDTKGVAAVEFALVLPVMLLVYVGSVEAGSLISVDKRVQSVAAAMGDLVSRSNTKIAACDIQDYFAAASATLMPYSATGLQQIVTSVLVKTDGTTEVQWSRAAGTNAKGENAVPYEKGDAFPLPEAMTDISNNAYVIVSEAAYSYHPITTLIYDQTIPLRRENFYLPRFGGSIEVNPTDTSAC
ncbi:MAG TPA: TadE/TadG family type IV pilus assembly protein [Devosia sp.]|nr:TadE/TadG family type IV pilus assembly protein [Devosia sp.]